MYGECPTNHFPYVHFFFKVSGSLLMQGLAKCARDGQVYEGKPNVQWMARCIEDSQVHNG